MLDDMELDNYDEFDRADKFIDDQLISLFNGLIEENYCICCNELIPENETMCESCKEHNINCFE